MRPNGMQPSVEAIDLRRTFVDAEQAIPALRGFTARVRQGEFVAVVGPRGSGKSTLPHLLGGLDRPTQGTVTVAGTDLGSLCEQSLTSFRSTRIGFVF